MGRQWKYISGVFRVDEPGDDFHIQHIQGRRAFADNTECSESTIIRSLARTCILDSTNSSLRLFAERFAVGSS